MPVKNWPVPFSPLTPYTPYCQARAHGDFGDDLHLWGPHTGHGCASELQWRRSELSLGALRGSEARQGWPSDVPHSDSDILAGRAGGQSLC
jgi:hypothetical protein